MDTKLVFAIVFLVLFIIIFFFYVYYLRKYLDVLIDKGAIYYNIREKRDLNIISFLFIAALVVSFIIGYLLG